VQTNDQVLAELMAEDVALIKVRGALTRTGCRMTCGTSGGFCPKRSEKTEINAGRFPPWLDTSLKSECIQPFTLLPWKMRGP